MRLRRRACLPLVACAAVVCAAVAFGAAAFGVAAPAFAAGTGRPTLPWQGLLLRGTGLVRVGSALYLDGAPFRFTGVNAYELGTEWSLNPGCGTQVSNLGELFDALPAGSVLRFWAFQSLAVDKHTRSLNFAALDRVVAAAQQRGDLLIMTLTDQAGTCGDGEFHDAAWYAGGWRDRYLAPAQDRDLLSYAGWVRAVVTRYRDSPAVGMWEPVNEPEASDCAAGYTGAACFGHTSCPARAAALLRDFFDAVGGEIHRLDPGVPVAAGLQGGAQCGTAGAGYATVAGSPGLDVLTYHDYGFATVGLPAELAVRLRQAAAAGKPLFVEEAGIHAGSGAGCRSPAARSGLVAGKVAAALTAGAVGWLAWNWVPAAPDGCSYDIGPGDPALATLGALLGTPGSAPLAPP